MKCDPAKIVILGPQGPQGPQGVQGPQGIPGMMGPQGPPGNDEPGIIKDFGGIIPPSGYLICDHTLYPNISYPDLYNAIGTLWNLPGDPIGFFRVPNLVGKVTVMLDTMEVSMSGAPYVGYTGGEWQHQLTIDEMPSHNHTVPFSGVNYEGNDNPSVRPSGTTGSSYTGGNLPHNNLQPYAVVLKIIKY